jgi:hypothetical protein
VHGCRFVSKLLAWPYVLQTGGAGLKLLCVCVFVDGAPVKSLKYVVSV